MKSVDTYEAKIFLGFREGYIGWMHIRSEVEMICQTYCDDIGLCVTITDTTFIYSNGKEDGVIIGLINYPRFPDESEGHVDIVDKAKELARRLMGAMEQKRVSIVCSDKTIMLENNVDV